jgi:hypothetical protein
VSHPRASASSRLRTTLLEDLVGLAEKVRPVVVMLTAIDPARLEERRVELTILGRAARLLLGGPAAGQELAEAVGARFVSAGPVEAAAQVAAEHV